VNPNIAVGSLLTLQISQGIVALFEKMMVGRSLRHNADIGKQLQLLFANNKNRVR
jgi:hypothetical protein